MYCIIVNSQCFYFDYFKKISLQKTLETSIVENNKSYIAYTKHAVLLLQAQIFRGTFCVFKHTYEYDLPCISGFCMIYKGVYIKVQYENLKK